MRFLVAGASGFLGRHLVEGLRANGDEVRSLEPVHRTREPARRKRDLVGELAHAQAMPGRARQPEFLAQNGVGWYGDQGSEVITEASESRGDAFMTNVSRQWQAATTASSTARTRPGSSVT